MPWSVKLTDSRTRPRTAVLLTALSLAVAGAASEGRAEPPTQQAGVSSAVKGEVDRASTVTETDRRQPLKPGSKVFMQDRVSSEADSLAQLLLLDQSTFKLGPDSSVVIDEFIYDPEQGTGEMVVEAAGGVMRFISGAIGKSDPDKVEINTPLGTLGVRGTMVTVSIRNGPDGQPQEALYVLNGPGADTNALARRGAIQVTAAGKTVTVQRAGWGTFVRPGQPPSPPQPIPSETIDLLDQQLSTQPPSGGGPADGDILQAVNRIGVDRLSGQSTATSRQRGDTQNQVDPASQATGQRASGEELERDLLQVARENPEVLQVARENPEFREIAIERGLIDHDLPSQDLFTEFGLPQTYDGLLSGAPGEATVTQADIPLYQASDLENLGVSDVEGANSEAILGQQMQGTELGSYDVSLNVNFSEKTFEVDFNNISFKGEILGNLRRDGDIPLDAIFRADGQVGGVTTSGIVIPLGTDEQALSGILSALAAETDPMVVGVGLTGAE